MVRSNVVNSNDEPFPVGRHAKLGSGITFLLMLISSCGKNSEAYISPGVASVFLMVSGNCKHIKEQDRVIF